MLRPRVTLVLALLAGAAATGCTQRTLQITSEPSGALVHLNDEEVGRTPVDVPFTFYGEYDVRLEHDAASPLWTTRKASPPWWETPPIDLLFEALPGTDVRIAWHFELPPDVEPTRENADRLVDHARQLRAKLRQPVEE